jgi:hypothetical protein
MKTWITTRTLAAAALVTFLPASGATLGIQPEPFRTGFFGVTAGQTLRMSVVNAGDVNEVAIERELADDRIDLTERQRHRRSAFHVLAHEAIRGHPDLECRCGGVLHDRDAVLLGQSEDAEDPAHAGGALVLMDVDAAGDFPSSIPGTRSARPALASTTGSPSFSLPSGQHPTGRSLPPGD